MSEYKICYRLFNEFCSKLYRKNYVLSPSHAQKIQLNNFISNFKLEYGSIDFDLLFRYISFQFNYWSTLDYTKRSLIEVNWIFGKKAIERWKGRREEYFYFVERDFIKKYKINYIELKQLFEKKSKPKLEVRDYEEKIKEKHYNTEVGLSYCIDHTTLYNEKSLLCLQCNNSKSCIQILSILYPQLYKRRICVN